MTIPRFGTEASPEEVASALADDGVAVIESLVGAEVMDRVLSELGEYLETTPTGPDDFSGRQTRRTGALIARSPTARDLVTHPRVLEVVGRVLGHSTNYQLHLTQVIGIEPGQPAQPIHRDQWAFDFFAFPSGYEVQCNTIWAMTDFTEANGATRVMPGSQRLADRLRFTEADTEPATMPKGSVVFYTGSLYHGGGANRSVEVRYGANITYSVAWLRQEENQYLSVPLDVAAGLPEDLQRLMGYAHGAYALGYVDDLRDPIEVLRPGTTAPGLAGAGQSRPSRIQSSSGPASAS
jgi:ectoine hydroxylase-related dioxygenase (phytanoyl-CoA dioxygenase family)